MRMQLAPAQLPPAFLLHNNLMRASHDKPEQAASMGLLAQSHQCHLGDPAFMTSPNPGYLPEPPPPASPPAKLGIRFPTQEQHLEGMLEPQQHVRDRQGARPHGFDPNPT